MVEEEVAERRGGGEQRRGRRPRLGCIPREAYLPGSETFGPLGHACPPRRRTPGAGTSGGAAAQAPPLGTSLSALLRSVLKSPLLATLQAGDLRGSRNVGFCLSGQVSLCSPGWLGARSVDQVGLELTGAPPASASEFLTLAAFTNHRLLLCTVLNSDPELRYHSHVLSLTVLTHGQS